MVYVNFTSQLNSVGGLGSASAWVEELRESDHGILLKVHKVLVPISKMGRFAILVWFKHMIL